MFAPSLSHKRKNSRVCSTPGIFSDPKRCFFKNGKDFINLCNSPKAGEIRPVVSLMARLMHKPQFLGASVISVRRGALVKVIKVAGSWCYVFYRGRNGWIHRNRIMRAIIRLRSGDTGTGISRGENETAARG